MSVFVYVRMLYIEKPFFMKLYTLIDLVIIILFPRRLSQMALITQDINACCSSNLKASILLRSRRVRLVYNLVLDVCLDSCVC